MMPVEADDDDDDALLKYQQASVSLSRSTPMVNKTVAELKEECRNLGLKKTGSKPMLIERLEKAHNRLDKGIPIRDNEVQRSGKMEWYMLQTANGFEGTVARTLKMAIDAKRLNEDIEKVFVPLLEGETSVRESSVMPSYIFVRMRMNKNLYQFVSNMQYVVNFVGADCAPQPATPACHSCARGDHAHNAAHVGACHAGSQMEDARPSARWSATEVS